MPDILKAIKKSNDSESMEEQEQESMPLRKNTQLVVGTTEDEIDKDDDVEDDEDDKDDKE